MNDSIVNKFSEIKADYDGMRPSKFRRERRYLGGSADAHLGYSWLQYWKLRETCRDMMRNDGIIGQALKRAADNIFRGGFKLEMQTGNKGLNDEIEGLMGEWMANPYRCDARETLTFHEQAKQAWLQLSFDGDVFGALNQDGYVQWVEGDRCVTAGARANMVHGVLLGRRDEPVEYWFAKPYLPYERTMHTMKVGDTFPVAAKDSYGERAICHLFKPSRFSMTRGVPLFTGCLDTAGMLEDLNFAKLVQAQVVSCISAWIETSPDPNAKPSTPAIGSQPGRQSLPDGTSAIIEKLEPGKVPILPPGKKMVPFTPAVPNAEYFQHVQLLLRIIGANIGLPLSIILLDTSSTNFSGYRGELEQARMGFEDNQQFMIHRLHRPVTRWKIRSFLADRLIKSRAADGMLKTGEIFQHKWLGQGWPYIEPQKDATADATILANMLDSPRGVASRKGREFDDILNETIADNTATVKRCIEAAQAISKSTGEDVTWRDVLDPRKATIKVTADDQGEATDPGSPPQTGLSAPPKKGGAA